MVGRRSCRRACTCLRVCVRVCACLRVRVRVCACIIRTHLPVLATTKRGVMRVCIGASLHELELAPKDGARQPRNRRRIAAGVGRHLGTLHTPPNATHNRFTNTHTYLCAPPCAHGQSTNVQPHEIARHPTRRTSAHAFAVARRHVHAHAAAHTPCILATPTRLFFVVVDVVVSSSSATASTISAGPCRGLSRGPATMHPARSLACRLGSRHTKMAMIRSQQPPTPCPPQCAVASLRPHPAPSLLYYPRRSLPLWVYVGDVFV